MLLIAKAEEKVNKNEIRGKKVHEWKAWEEEEEEEEEEVLIFQTFSDVHMLDLVSFPLQLMSLISIVLSLTFIYLL